MEEIIAPVDKKLIKAELTPERFMRQTRKANNEIYIVNCYNAPNVLKEIGRLREIAFRYAGGMILWRSRASSSLSGILRLRRYWVVIVLFWVRMSNMILSEGR